MSMHRCPNCGMTGAKVEAKLRRMMKVMGVNEDTNKVQLPNTKPSWDFIESLRAIAHNGGKRPARGRKPFWFHHKETDTVYYVAV